MLNKIIVFFILLGLFQYAWAANRFSVSELKSEGNFILVDQDLQSWQKIFSYLQKTSSVQVNIDVKLVDLKSKSIFSAPFLVYRDRGKINWNALEKENLKQYLVMGGFLFVENCADNNDFFDRSFRQVIKEIFPDQNFKRIEKNHAIYRSFYLLRDLYSCANLNKDLEKIEINGRTVLIYSSNNVLGSWSKNSLGNFNYLCLENNKDLRWEVQKLMLNIIFYSLTGTYKTDPVHLPYIEQKLRR